MRHRWLVATGAIIIQMSLGTIYAWGVFKDARSDKGLAVCLVPFLVAGGLCVVAATLIACCREPRSEVIAEPVTA